MTAETAMDVLFFVFLAGVLFRSCVSVYEAWCDFKEGRR